MLMYYIIGSQCKENLDLNQGVSHKFTIKCRVFLCSIRILNKINSLFHRLWRCSDNIKTWAKLSVYAKYIALCQVNRSERYPNVL